MNAQWAMMSYDKFVFSAVAGTAVLTPRKI